MSGQECRIKVEYFEQGPEPPKIRVVPQSADFSGCQTITWVGVDGARVSDVAIRPRKSVVLPRFNIQSKNGHVVMDVPGAKPDGVWRYLLKVNDVWFSKALRPMNDPDSPEDPPEMRNGVPDIEDGPKYGRAK